MLVVNERGEVISPQVTLNLFAGLQRGAMPTVSGIIVHQTGGSTAQSTFNSYRTSAYGAHFLIDKDGTIYQTAAINQRTNHVGPLRARCIVAATCTPAELTLYGRVGPTQRNRAEMEKSVPARYPSNSDSIGIELVGEATGPRGQEVYVTVPAPQNTSLAWLVRELAETLQVPLTEVFRHPEVSQKNPTEASTAQW
jgi:N-acetyl-anhydromuramyl-L-alanine amidase AmpD